ncbi:Gfo/Idh/MocA family protein [Pontivivens insulae]|uniref:1,5-anhydro-D-fructose reductase n=1 Tax=Pontivivens insulae TaxID=1639689 RepID=A0A2R8A902_9RHOB|nr:Gfo/Idh/MocA family oxidoreductase [Pontivivens insulae]RED18801.1 putative dehydrogenase [Pontivivens insulae]SPF28699.1 1,5-anhydro-D-fructose reductase [Pontivivens insulae]
MSELIGVGIIGCGNISTAYLRLASLFAGYEVRAVADLNIEAAKAQAEAFDVRAETVDDLLGAADIDLIVNLTIPAAHAAVSKAALEAGKHVYSEKPFVLSVDEGEELAKLAAANGLRVGSAPDTFLGASHQLARHLVDSGQMGRITSGTAMVMSPGMESWHPNPDFFFQPGAGPVLDIGPYYICNLVQLLGPVASVTAFTGAASDTRTIGNGPRQGETVPVETPTTIHAVLRFHSGAIITLIGSWDVWSNEHNNMELYGTDGTMYVPDPNFFGGDLRITAKADAVATPAWSHPFGVANDGDHANYRGAGLADMVQAIAQGRPHRCSLEFSLHVVDVMTSILRAGETGQVEQISTSCDRPDALTPDAAQALMA